MAALSEIAQGINLLKIAFPNYQPDIKQTAELWTAVLGDLPGDTLKAAILECLVGANRQFAPTIGEIRGQALRLNAIAAGIPEGWTAFGEVCKMPRDMIDRELVIENGQNIILERELHFSHPLVEDVARKMGWPKSFPTDMPAADRAQFIKAYDAELFHALESAGRIKVVSDYIDSRRQMGADGLSLTANLTKRLEVSHA